MVPALEHCLLSLDQRVGQLWQLNLFKERRGVVGNFDVEVAQLWCLLKHCGEFGVVTTIAIISFLLGEEKVAK